MKVRPTGKVYGSASRLSKGIVPEGPVAESFARDLPWLERPPSTILRACRGVCRREAREAGTP